MIARGDGIPNSAFASLRIRDGINQDVWIYLFDARTNSEHHVRIHMP